MSIEFLNAQGNWNKVKAGLRVGKSKFTPSYKKASFRFEPAKPFLSDPNPVTTNAFTGKSFSQRKK